MGRGDWDLTLSWCPLHCQENGLCWRRVRETSSGTCRDDQGGGAGGLAWGSSKGLGKGKPAVFTTTYDLGGGVRPEQQEEGAAGAGQWHGWEFTHVV